MLIAHLVKADPNSWGGGEKYVRDLCEWSVKDGHRVLIFTNGDVKSGRRFAPPGVELKGIPYAGFFDLVSPWKVAQTICSYPDDEVILHVHGFKDAMLALRTKRIIGKRKKVKVICTRHIVKPAKTSYYWNRIYQGIDKIIFVSGVTKELFLSSNPSVDHSKLSVIHNSIVPPAADSLTSDLREKESRIKLLYTGRIFENKGIDILIKSLSYLKDEDVELTIAGSGHEALVESLKSMAESLNVADRIKWIGFKENVFPVINESDICVVPTKCREAFGLVVIEYMSQGKPVISTDNGGQKEIITDGVDGLLVPPEDPVALANAIRRLIADRELRKNMGTEALKTFRDKFSYPVFFAKTIAAYRS